ncbi:unnamed protein product [Dimorphilus gyrociliatus]|uniref:Uncharacterized protein n=1 Tax=Dimorphilus gyrociliatus TaxID=2664684 RepID=A0A7I8VWB9_9ANNE|nr:unnamed protein product [Dimorphilus gyrociliatus]
MALHEQLAKSLSIKADDDWPEDIMKKKRIVPIRQMNVACRDELAFTFHSLNEMLKIGNEEDTAKSLLDYFVIDVEGLPLVLDGPVTLLPGETKLFSIERPPLNCLTDYLFFECDGTKPLLHNVRLINGIQNAHKQELPVIISNRSMTEKKLPDRLVIGKVLELASSKQYSLHKPRPPRSPPKHIHFSPSKPNDKPRVSCECENERQKKKISMLNRLQSVRNEINGLSFAINRLVSEKTHLVEEEKKIQKILMIYNIKFSS